MPEYYYTQMPSSKSDERRIEVSVAGLSLSFVTDAGVFSKAELDDGTKLLIEAVLEEGTIVRGRVLDLGCGWGPVGTALYLKNSGIELVMSDINERAVELSKRNAESNGVQAQVVQSDAFENIEGSFDCIITNPPIRTGKATIYGMFDTAYERLNAGGSLTIVIRKQQGAESAFKHLNEVFGNARVIDKKKSYWIITSRKN